MLSSRTERVINCSMAGTSSTRAARTGDPACVATPNDRRGRRVALQRERELCFGGVEYGARRLVIIVVTRLVVAIEHDAVFGAQYPEVLAQALAVSLAGLVASPVGSPIPRCEMRELRLDEWQVALARGRLEAKRAGSKVRRLRLGDRTHERLEQAWRVGDAGEHRHDVHSDLDPVRPQSRDGSETRLGRRGARLETARQLAVRRDQRDVHG